jgi:phospholipase C
MAMSGFSMIDVNHDLLPDQYLVYDWLNDNKVSWRVYHQGIPFFTMMDRWIPEILLSGHFRNFDDLQGDLMNTAPDQLPQVIFIEPTYQDAPHLGLATDEHAPSGVSNGQEFLMQAYNAVTNSRALWQGVVMIVDYDEHGGFFDHVSPPMTPTSPPAGASYTDSFASLGVRTPAYVISPFVQPGVVNHLILDHTSVLKLIGEKFGKDGSYSALVDARPVSSVSAMLNFANPVAEPPPAPALDDYLADRPPTPAGATVPPQNTPVQRAFLRSVDGMRQNGAGSDHPKFGKLLDAMTKQIPSPNLPSPT